MRTSIFYYCAFALVVLTSVLFGLDWQPATLSPMPPIRVVALPPPPVKPPEPVAAVPPTPAPTSAPRPASPRPGSVAPNPATPVAPAVPPVAAMPPRPLCDVAACAAAYRSFRESDCTYNPSVGPRQLCTKGVVPAATVAPTTPPAIPDPLQPSIMQPEPGRQPAAAATAQPAVKCNVSACAAAYRTFTESDCTFMASGGQRKLCTR